MHLHDYFLNVIILVALTATLWLLPGCAGRTRLVNEAAIGYDERTEPLRICDGKLLLKDFSAYDCKGLTDLSISDTLCLTVPDGDTYLSVIERSTINVNQTHTIRASVAGYPSGYFLISVTHCTGTGTFKIPEISLAWNVYADTVTGVFSFKKADPSMQMQRDSVLIPKY